ncbi:SDR family NAD(P)-dependent oxidoreductase [Stenotrophobium rhamnosiphilum]|uniref:NADP-dependent 3-hydroxy acid dehydrogenase n=1 Tax=Stenotrophobium rhamnosiphilum TaxID=2029166 RepID=A0A2T5MBV5_9GAMM|nr:SDR family NAD(P)-dependent oxidoreductase [Stenotrophobium rhamnosiphilum]PTU30054.1 NADP-dependent 3-hydroxy acid dehydrogenase [Stenotrophobium rhamnosiphilum]
MQTPPVVFVTGATAGFGLAITRRFLADGCRIVICGRRVDRLDALQKELGDLVHAIPLDVRDREDVEGAIASLPPAFSDIDILVNNAGLALGTLSAAHAEVDDWDVMVDTNIKGLMYCTHTILPGMIARGRGHIVNMGSVAGEFAYPGGNAYGGSKAFVRQFSKNLRADLIGTPVRVTYVAPGLSGGTEFSQVRLKGDEAKAASVYQDTQPLSADDIADSVHWAATRPAHVNINEITLMPVCQAPGPMAVHRGAKK